MSSVGEAFEALACGECFLCLCGCRDEDMLCSRTTSPDGCRRCLEVSLVGFTCWWVLWAVVVSDAPAGHVIRICPVQGVIVLHPWSQQLC